jgi:hypothetical protein
VAKKRSRKKRHEPYRPVKQKFFRIPNPFGDAPLKVRRAAMLEAAANARRTFEEEYPKIINWFDTYDPLYVLSFCLFYFLTSERGVDTEAVEGKLEFAPFHLELLQAFALVRKRSGTPAPLRGKALELRRSMKEITSALQWSQMGIPLDASESDVKKLFVIGQMRQQTFAIRNWAYPDQAIAHLKALFEGTLGEVVSREYGGVSIVKFIDSIGALAEEANERLNAHIMRVSPMVAAKDADSAYQEYRKGFPFLTDDQEDARAVFVETCRGDLKYFKAALIAHSDLFLQDLFTFSIDDVMLLYGEPAHRDGVHRILRAWSHEFGALAAQDPKRFLYSNPVLVRPFIALGGDSFFWGLGGILAHTLQAMLESLVPASARQRYLERRAKYLEESVEALFKKAFPDGHVFRGSQWRATPNDPALYENDLLVTVDSTCIVVECKSHLVDPPARRGAEFRLIDTLEDLVVSASNQAQRFVEFLRSHPEKHSFSTRSGRTNTVDVSRTVRFIPISVTFENLGFVSANLKDALQAGLIETGHALVPSVSLTDLEVVFEVLDSQIQRIHYLARRSETEKTMHYVGDESDLLAFYVENGFNIGEAEYGNQFIGMVGKSKELDPYFMARADGVAVPKPTLQLTGWWRDLLTKIEELKKEFWTEVAYILLNVAFEDQQKFEREFEKLATRVLKGLVSGEHNWMVMVSGTLSKRQYMVIGYPYTTRDREERIQMMKHMVATEEEERPVLGTVVIGMDLDAAVHPYNMLAYFPGAAPGGPEVGQLLGNTGL